jgi:hypothetical protein
MQDSCPHFAQFPHLQKGNRATPFPRLLRETERERSWPSLTPGWALGVSLAGEVSLSHMAPGTPKVKAAKVLVKGVSLVLQASQFSVHIYLNRTVVGVCSGSLL